MKIVFLTILIGIFITYLIFSFIESKNPFRKIIFFFARKKNNYKSVYSDYHYEFEQNVFRQEVHNKLPKNIEKKYSIVYNHFYTCDSEIIIFKDKYEKWGALRFIEEDNSYQLIVEPIYYSVGFNINNKLIEAVTYNSKKNAENKANYFLYDKFGKLFNKILNIDYLQFDLFGNILVSQGKLYAIFNENFQNVSGYKYKILKGLAKNIFLGKESINSISKILNGKDEILAEFPPSTFILGNLVNDKLIVKGDAYFVFDIYKKEKTEIICDNIIRCVSFNLKDIYNYKILTYTHKTPIDELDFLTHIIQTNAKWGLISAEGKTLIQKKYDYIEEVSKTLYKAVIGNLIFEEKENYDCIIKGGTWGIVNENDEIIIPFDYDYISFDLRENIFHCYRDGELSIDVNEHDTGFYYEGGKVEKIKIIKK